MSVSVPSGSIVKIQDKAGNASVSARKIKKLRLRIGAPFPGSMPKPQIKDKHVESTLAACLDEGSNPSSSTK